MPLNESMRLRRQDISNRGGAKESLILSKANQARANCFKSCFSASTTCVRLPPRYTDKLPERSPSSRSETAPVRLPHRRGDQRTRTQDHNHASHHHTGRACSWATRKPNGPSRFCSRNGQRPARTSNQSRPSAAIKVDSKSLSGTDRLLRWQGLNGDQAHDVEALERQR